MRAHGKVNVIALLIVGALLYGAWWGLNFGKAYLTNTFDVKDAVVKTFNQWGLRNEETLRSRLAIMLNGKNMGHHLETNDMGEDVEVGGLGVSDDNIFIDADDNAKHLTIRVEYDQTIHLWPLKGTRVVHFVSEKSGPYPR